MNYLCKNCHSLLASHSSLVYKQRLDNDTELNFLTFKNILNFKVDLNTKYDFFTNLYCSHCNQQIGMRITQDYSLYKSVLIAEPKIIKIGIFSLKQTLIDHIQVNVQEYQKINYLLYKKELNDCNPKNMDGAIILHQIESRVLLIGKNGLYNDLIQKLWKITNGNVCLYLIGDDQIDEQSFINNLSLQGQQPLLIKLFTQGHLIFNSQQNQLTTLIKNFKYKQYHDIFQISIPNNIQETEDDKEYLLLYYSIRLREKEYLTSQDKILRKLLKQSYQQITSSCQIY